MLEIEKTQEQIEAEKNAKAVAILSERMTSKGYSASVAGQDYTHTVNALAIAERLNRCVILSGLTGCGKTFAMQSAHPEARFIRMAVDGDVLALTENVSDFCRLNPLIILDDVGEEHTVNDYGIKKEVFVNFVMEWYSLNRPSRLLITTNLSGQAMDARYGARVMSRLLAVCEIYPMKGKDKRKKETCDFSRHGISDGVKIELQKFQDYVTERGKENIYYKAYIRGESWQFTDPKDRHDFQQGVLAIMDGHDGCTDDPDADGPTLMQGLAEMLAGKMNITQKEGAE